MRSIALLAAGWSLAILAGCAGEPTRHTGETPRAVAAAPTPARPATATTSPSAGPASAMALIGRRIKLKTVGEVFVPDCLPAEAERVDLVMHFHGAPDVVEREFVAAGLRAVLVTVNYGGLSSVYEQPFSDTRLFGTVLDEALAELKGRKLVSPAAEWQRICVSSFSAGFGAVRAILTVPAYFERIDALYLADTLYAGYVGPSDRQTVDPDNVRDFRRFAVEAAAGRKTLVITHSYLVPGTYAGTHETADDLIAFVRVERQPVDEPGPAGMHVISRASQGNFSVWGCAGQSGQDHMAHLRNMRFWYPRLPVDRAPAAR